ncbi:MAG TPA: BMP family ABC transporter substrate-binding protein [Anaerolineae bacterium]|nr:BMP family ABC transporter substrate-binding protein [Anaerolineae bacterium]
MVLTLLVVLSMLLAACAKKKTPAPPTPTPTQAAPTPAPTKPAAKAPAALRVGLVTDVGKVDDGTFNQYAYEGMMRAVKESSLDSAFIETLQPTDYEKNVEQFAQEGYDMIITVGFMMGDTTKKMAEKYPDIKFAIVDFAYDPPVPNIQGLVFREDQSGFLAGALAGQMTKSKVVGIVAGMEIPPVKKFRNGYEHGVKCVCPDCEVLGVYIDSFTDPARGKTAALSQVNEGADVIFGAGGPTGSGAIQGAAQEGVYVIGVDQDEYYTTFKKGEVKGADKLLSSAMKRVDEAVYQAVRSVVDGTYKGGTRVFEASNNGVGLAPFHDTEGEVPQEVKDTLNAIFKKLADGSLKTGVDPLGDPIPDEIPAPGSCVSKKSG